MSNPPCAIRQTLRTIRKFFPLRTCTNAEFKNRTRPCIQHQIGRCGAPIACRCLAVGARRPAVVLGALRVVGSQPIANGRTHVALRRCDVALVRALVALVGFPVLLLEHGARL